MRPRFYFDRRILGQHRRERAQPDRGGAVMKKRPQRALLGTTSVEGNLARLAVSNPLMTVEELANTEFQAVPELANFKNDYKAIKEHGERLRSLSITSRFAIEILGRSKAELIALIKEMRDDLAVTLLDGLGEGR